MIVENYVYSIYSEDKKFIRYRFLVTLASTKYKVIAKATELNESDFHSQPHVLIWYVSIDHNRKTISIPMDTIHSIKSSGMGRELVNLVVHHIKSIDYKDNWSIGQFPPDINQYCVTKAKLSSVDANEENYARRQAFYERAGFVIEYSDEQGNGYVYANKVSDLISLKTKPNILIEPANESLTRLLKAESDLTSLQNQVELQNQQREKEKESQDIGKRKAFNWGLGIGIFFIVFLYLAFNSFINN